jgi:hypothetical protein
MSNTDEQKPSLSRKFIVTAALLLILVALPAISYLYLRDGLAWRKTAVAELGEYGKILPAYAIYPGNVRIDELDGKVCVVHVFEEAPTLTPENQKILEVCDRLCAQFGQADGFRMAMVAEKQQSDFRAYWQKLPTSDNFAWSWTGARGSWGVVMDNGYKVFTERGARKADRYFALADTSGTIRRFYNALDEKEINRMVQQIAILMPTQ